MIPAKYSQLVFVFFMTLMMGLVLSLVFELQASDFRVPELGAFVGAWLRRFLGTYVIVLPVVVVLNPIAGRLSKLVIAKPPADGGHLQTRAE
jgi:hypothetical protein